MNKFLLKRVYRVCVLHSAPTRTTEFKGSVLGNVGTARFGFVRLLIQVRLFALLQQQFNILKIYAFGLPKKFA